MSDDRFYDKLKRSGTIIIGAGKLLEVGAKLVGYCYPTIDGLFHVFDDHGEYLNVFATQHEADDWIKTHWLEDGTVDPGFAPIKLQ